MPRPTTGKQACEKVDRDVVRRYDVARRIGRGCFGVVFEVFRKDVEDDEEDCAFAMKKVLSAFRQATDAQRTYREVVYLMEFKGHPNIVEIFDVLVSSDDRHLYIFMSLMDSDLGKALLCQCLLPTHRPYIAYQILKALKYIHSAEVMHRDLKPSNVLLNKLCEVRVADFGWARTSPAIELHASDVSPMTDYASTRWYRSPEQLLGSRRYTKSIDMWAYGCVVGEMHRDRQPLLGGTSTIDMMIHIIGLVGKPLDGDIAALQAPYAQLWLGNLPLSLPQNTVRDLLVDPDEVVVDFVELLVQVNPNKRLTAAEALTHPYLSAFHNPDEEPVFGRLIQHSLPDEEQFTASQYRDEIYANVIGLESAKFRVAKMHQRRKEEALELSEEDGDADEGYV